MQQTKEILFQYRGDIQLKGDAYSPLVLKGYIIIAGHWIESNRERCGCDYKGPHSRMIDWEFYMRLVRTDNATNMVEEMRRWLVKRKEIEFGRIVELVGSHICCIPHVLNFAVRECM